MSQMDGISAEHVEVTGHAVCRYIERLGRGTSKQALADMAIRSKAISEKNKRRLGLVVKDDGSYEWRRCGKALLLLRYGKDEHRHRCAIIITVMEQNDARRNTTSHRNNVQRRPKKPKKRRR